MKQKDFAVIIIVAAIAGIFSLFLSQKLFTGDKNRKLTVEKVSPISSEFKEADPKVFNKDAVNPTQLIKIGEDANANPF